MSVLNGAAYYQTAGTYVTLQPAASIGQVPRTARLARHRIVSRKCKLHAAANGGRESSSNAKELSANTATHSSRDGSFGRGSSGASSSGRTTGEDAVTAAGITLPMGAAARAATPLEAFKEGALGFGFSAGG